MESEKVEQIDRLKKEFSVIPEVQQCFYVTGESDFLLIMVVPSMAYYETLTRKIFFGNENIKRFRTIVVMGISKSTLEIPVKMDSK